MDELKKYLQQHADELDLDEPRPQVWERISAQSAVPVKGNVVMMVSRWAIAACVIILAGIGIWHLAGSNSQQPGKTTAQVTPVQKETVTPPAEEQQVQPSGEVENNTASVIPASKTGPSHKNNRMPHSAGAVDRTEEMHALTDMENSFTQVINLQRARVSTTPMYAETPAYFNDFKVQLKQMDKDEKGIKTDIARRGLNDALLDQLINLYQQKLNILKQLQLEMNKTNNRFKQNRGPVDTTRTYFLNI